MCKYAVLSVLLLALSCPAWAQLQKFCLPGIAPSHHVTSLELSPGTTVIDDKANTSLNNVTAKLYYAFSPNYNVGVELPFARFESPLTSVNGLGDLSISAQAVQTDHPFDFGAKMELLVPTATDDSLGSGKLVASPSVFVVHPFTANFFVAAGYKHYLPIAGDGGREDVNRGRVRFLFSYMNEAQWWITFDPQYYMDYENSGQAELIWESELGVMVNPGVAMYIKPGAHLAGNWQTRDWTLNIGFKILYL